MRGCTPPVLPNPTTETDPIAASWSEETRGCFKRVRGTCTWEFIWASESFKICAVFRNTHLILLEDLFAAWFSMFLQRNQCPLTPSPSIFFNCICSLHLCPLSWFLHGGVLLRIPHRPQLLPPSLALDHQRGRTIFLTLVSHLLRLLRAMGRGQRCQSPVAQWPPHICSPAPEHASSPSPQA